ncbi:spore gernimation protein GerPD [Paenibacillus doosanensis]|uniref:Spore germination protein GerPD n=1 Tax=Paenibacillus konkukensis TaxID=2020716 RepID=A0ABY4RJ00_9BACL|nr:MULTISPECIES: spore gernimation protein GerPD [Paenibacillus]MCS7464410.1 spore gernimation protein GerPD [Paenibacillus doosanensis]UQZ82158.1 putative spore germination protein GerPD [Paenibacillus konkukensis]
MEFTVINGELVVDYADVTYVSTSSTFMIGDIRSIALSSAFDTPPEKVIIGVTIPIIG